MQNSIEKKQHARVQWGRGDINLHARGIKNIYYTPETSISL